MNWECRHIYIHARLQRYRRWYSITPKTLNTLEPAPRLKQRYSLCQLALARWSVQTYLFVTYFRDIYSCNKIEIA